MWYANCFFTISGNINKEEMIMKRIKILLLVLCTAVMLLGLTLSASASTITITPSTTPVWYGDTTSEPSAADIVAKVGYMDTLDLLYKSNVGGSEDGTYAASYDTNYNSNDPEDATITYVQAPSISTDYKALYLLVKDGNHTPQWYVFNLLDVNGVVWNRTDTIYIQDFWTGQGAISNVAIFGGETEPPPGPNPSPEPATLLLLGLGLVGLAGTRRNFKC